MWNEVLENLVVVKRSGQRVDFNASKIAIAIKKAFDAVYDETDEKETYKVFESVLKYINDNYKDRKTINVEDIQDIIETKLKEMGFDKVYIAFKDYRQKRAASRKVFSEKQQHKFVKVVEKIESENIDDNLTPEKLLKKFGIIISSEYAKSYVLDTKFVRALEEGNIYVHNLDYLSLGYYSHVNLKLEVKDDDEYLDEFLSEIVNAKNEINSEIGINNIDLILKKYFLNYYKKLLEKYLINSLKLKGVYELIGFKKIQEVINKIDDIDASINIFEAFTVNVVLHDVFDIVLKDALFETEEFINKTIYRILDVIRANYNSDITCTISMSNDNSIICLNERLNILNYLTDNNYINNVHLIVKIIKDLDENYLTRIASLIINQKNISLSFPNSSFNVDNNEVEYFTNGLRIFENINDSERRSNGRMVVASTSINMARLGLKYLSKNIKDFYQEVDQLLDLVKNELLLSFENYGNKNKDNYLTLFNGNILGDERLESGQKIRKIIKTGTLNVGLIGLKECVLCLENDESKQYDLLMKIIKYFNKKMKQISDETKLNFCLFEPSGVNSRKYLMGIDKSIYGINKDITDKSMYDLIEDAKFINSKELSLVQKEFTGGSLITINISSKSNNKKVIELIKSLVDDDVGFVKIKVSNK